MVILIRKYLLIVKLLLYVAAFTFKTDCVVATYCEFYLILSKANVYHLVRTTNITK